MVDTFIPAHHQSAVSYCHNSQSHFSIFQSADPYCHNLFANCNNQIRPSAAEFVKPHHYFGDPFILGITNCQNLFRMEVLYIVYVSGMLYPFSPDTQKPAKDRRLGNRKNIIHFSYFESCTHCSQKIRQNVLHPTPFICLTKFRNPDANNLDTIDFFVIVFLCLIFIFNCAKITCNCTGYRNIEIFLHTFC